MANQQILEATDAEVRRVVELARSDPEAPVPQYPSWTSRDLVVHLAGVHGRTAVALRTLAQDRVPITDPPVGVDPFDWALEMLQDMIEALRVVDPTASMWTFGSDTSPAFWERRMLVETGVHRWDVQSAAGEPAPLLQIVATNGLDEFEDLYLHRLGEVSPLEMHDPALGRHWCYGDPQPRTTVEDSASGLYLSLMSRPGARLPDDWRDALASLSVPADYAAAVAAK